MSDRELELVRRVEAYRVYEASLMAEPEGLWFFITDGGQDYEVVAIEERRRGRGYMVTVSGTAVQIPIGEFDMVSIYKEVTE